MQPGYTSGERYILMVEDSREDFDAASAALCKVGLPLPVRRCMTGEEATAFLENNDGAALPDLILLDLGLPGENGREVLERIKSNENTRHIPIIILSVSNDRHDVEVCYERGASGYLHKPESPEDFDGMAKTLKSFWFDQALLPRTARS